MFIDVVMIVSKLVSVLRFVISNCWCCWEVFWVVDVFVGEMLVIVLVSEGLDVICWDLELGLSRRILLVVNVVVRLLFDNSFEGDVDYYGIGYCC